MDVLRKVLVTEKMSNLGAILLKVIGSFLGLVSMIGLLRDCRLFRAEDADCAESEPSHIFAVQGKYSFDMRLELRGKGKGVGLKNAGEVLHFRQCRILFRDNRRDVLVRGLDALVEPLAPEPPRPAWTFML